MGEVKWGLVGPGAIAANFAQGLAECGSGRLVAVAGRNAERRGAFAERFGAGRAFASAGELLAEGGVDAVYIATPHTSHAALAIEALRAGKHVLCEKPAGILAGETAAIAEVAAREGLFFMEALMYRCHAQVARLVELLRQGAIGQVRHVSARFGFAAPFDPASRLYDPELAGGAIFDVGVYPVSLARLVAGVAQDAPFAEPIRVAGTASLARSGVDEVACASLLFEGGITAEVACAVGLEMDNGAVVTGTEGTIRLDDPWAPGRDAGPSIGTVVVTRGGESEAEEVGHDGILFAAEAEVASRAILDGLTEAPHPAPSPADSIGTQRVLDEWRAQAGYVLPAETPAGLRVLPGTLPAGLPAMPTGRIPGLDRDVSRLIMGCDNRDTAAEGAIVWDAWMEAGGNAFDTAFVYGGGRHEAALGEWIAARGVAKDVVVVVKGAHTPYCTPRAIASQLDASLDRLGLDSAPVYIMHRDNPDVPVGEFVDALNELRAAGRIGAFGGSNWSVERFRAANDHAAERGLAPMTILNNNLALAVMERPVWDGCLSSNTPEALDYLAGAGAAHLSWSAQARGYFHDADRRTTLPESSAPDACFASEANEERRRRAAELAAERGVDAAHVALAWVLGQEFPSFALIGPRSPGEIATTLPALSVELTGAERDWLNLTRDDR